MPDSKRDKSSGQSQVDVHFPFSDYDIYEVSKCDENIKLLCIRKTKSTQFEKLFSKTLFSEKFKHLDNLETYLKEESSDVYLLFIHPVVPKVRVGPNKVPTSTLKTQECLVEFACQHILPKICTSVIVDIIESPAKTKIFGTCTYVVLNKTFSMHFSLNQISSVQGMVEPIAIFSTVPCN